MKICFCMWSILNILNIYVVFMCARVCLVYSCMRVDTRKQGGWVVKCMNGHMEHFRLSPIKWNATWHKLLYYTRQRVIHICCSVFSSSSSSCSLLSTHWNIHVNWCWWWLLLILIRMENQLQFRSDYYF